MYMVYVLPTLLDPSLLRRTQTNPLARTTSLALLLYFRVSLSCLFSVVNYYTQALSLSFLFIFVIHSTPYTVYRKKNTRKYMDSSVSTIIARETEDSSIVPQLAIRRKGYKRNREKCERVYILYMCSLEVLPESLIWSF